MGEAVSNRSTHDYSGFRAGATLLTEALRGPSTRVPVFAQMHEFVAAELGIPRRDFFTNPNISVPAILEVQSRYGLDVASVTYDVYNIEAEALGQLIRWTESGMPDLDRNAPRIRNKEDLTRIRTPDFDAVPACRRVLAMHALFRSLTGIEPGLSFCAPFTLATNLRGIEQLLLDIYAEPDFARELLHRLTEEVLAPWILHQKRHFPQARGVSGVDATASLPIVNLAILRDWAAPFILRLRELCGPEIAVVNWVGERYLPRPADMLDLKLAVGSGVLWGQDPDVADLGPDFYKTYADAHDVPLILGVGAARLAEDTPEQIAHHVRRYVEAGSRGGRFALYLCNLGATTPPENLRAAVAAAHGDPI